MLTEPRTTLRDLRVNADLSFTALASHLGTTESHIAAIEAGTATPTKAELTALAAVYGAPPASVADAAAATKVARKPRKRRQGDDMALIERREGQGSA